MVGYWPPSSWSVKTKKKILATIQSSWPHTWSFIIDLTLGQWPIHNGHSEIRTSDVPAMRTTELASKQNITYSYEAPKRSSWPLPICCNIWSPLKEPFAVVTGNPQSILKSAGFLASFFAAVYHSWGLFQLVTRHGLLCCRFFVTCGPRFLCRCLLPPHLAAGFFAAFLAVIFSGFFLLRRTYFSWLSIRSSTKAFYNLAMFQATVSAKRVRK